MLKPKCPIDVREKVWVEQRMQWLAEQFGLNRMLEAQFVLPTREFFPEPFEGLQTDAQRVLNRICEYMDVDGTRISLEFYRDEEQPNASGTYEPGETAIIRVAESELADQERLIATLAHELSHDLLLRDEIISADEDDHEQVTDLLTAFLGLGIFHANTVVQQHAEASVGWEYWSIKRTGYLSARVYGYAFALMAWHRHERKPAWARYLGGDAAAAFRQGLKFLTRTRDSLFASESTDESLSSRSWSGIVHQLQTGTDGQRVAALWELRRRSDVPTDAVAAIVGCLSRRNPSVCAEAATTLGYISEPNDEIVHKLLEECHSINAEVRAACAFAIGVLQPSLSEHGPDGTTVEQELTALLDDASRSTALSAAAALANYGVASARLVTRLLDALRPALVNCDFDDVHYFLSLVSRFEPDVDEFLKIQLAEWDTELQRLAADLYAEFTLAEERVAAEASSKVPAEQTHRC